MNFKRILWMYASGHVSRLHVVPLVRQHHINKHVYGSQMIAIELLHAMQIYSEEAAGRVLYTLLYHDAPEVGTGDIPSPTKRALPPGVMDSLEDSFYQRRGITMPQLSPDEKIVVEASDLGDLLMSCIEERRMGNNTRELANHSIGELSVSIEGVFRKVVGYMDTFPHPVVKDLLYNLVLEWEAANGRER